jgi:hypothetical protein
VTTAADHHGLSDLEARQHDELMAKAEQIGPGRFRLSPLAFVETFGTFTCPAADAYDAAFAAVVALRDGVAFWKR